MASTSKSDTNDIPDIFTTFHNVEIIRAPHIKPNIQRLIREGKYEKPEIEIGLANLKPGDRIMEMGTGAGIVGSVFLKQIDNLTLHSFEANPNLIPHIRKLYEHNGLDAFAQVSNNLVVTGSNAPKTMNFDVRDNFLGSRLSHFSEEDGGTTQAIPTKHYDEITTNYAHNVLVMNILGGELDFLADADLSNVDLVMLELHPKIYGEKGRNKAISHLTRKGFKFDETTSIGNVVSFKKPARMKVKPDYSHIGDGKESVLRYDIDPHASQASAIISVDNAVLAKTPRSEGFRIHATVFDSDRNAVPEAICWVYPQTSATIKRSYPRPKRIKDLSGTWLFGGRFFPHFGHFLTESVARLWALDHIKEKIEGILFFPTYNDHEEAAKQFFGNLAEIIDKPIPYKICDAFYRVDKLIVPPQGSGIGRLIASSPEMRQFLLDHLKRDFKPTGRDKIYISRSGQFGKIGRGFLQEKKLEKWLEEEGYFIFHPQDHSWEEQLAHYMSASHILGPDGSPFHLVNFTGRPDVKVGIFQRRPGHDAKQMANQGELFGLQNIYAFKHVGRYWGSAGDHRAAYQLISEIKFAPLCQELKEYGFIGPEADWADLTETELWQALEQHAILAGADQIEVDSLHVSLKKFARCEIEGSPQVFSSS